MFHSNSHFDSWFQRGREQRYAHEETQRVLSLQRWVPVPMRPIAIRRQKNPLGYIGQEREERRRQAQNDKMAQRQPVSDGTETLAQWRTTHRNAFPTQATNGRAAPKEFRITYSGMNTLQQGPSIGEEIGALPRDTHSSTATQQEPASDDDVPLLVNVEHAESSHSDVVTPPLPEQYTPDSEDNTGRGIQSGTRTPSTPDYMEIQPSPDFPNQSGPSDTQHGLSTQPHAGHEETSSRLSPPAVTSETGRETQNDTPTQAAPILQESPSIPSPPVATPDTATSTHNATLTQAPPPDQYAPPSRPSTWAPRALTPSQLYRNLRLCIEIQYQDHTLHLQDLYDRYNLPYPAFLPARPSLRELGLNLPIPLVPRFPAEEGRGSHSGERAGAGRRGYFMDPNRPAGWSQPPPPPPPPTTPSRPPPPGHPDYNPQPVLTRPYEAVPLFDTRGMGEGSASMRGIDEFLRGQPYMYPPHGTFERYGPGRPGGS